MRKDKIDKGLLLSSLQMTLPAILPYVILIQWNALLWTCILCFYQGQVCYYLDNNVESEVQKAFDSSDVVG